MKFISLLLIAIALICASCASQRNEALRAKFARMELRVGIDPNFPPVIFRENGKASGIESDIAIEIGKILGAKVVFIEAKWSELIPALNNADFDVIMSGMTITDERSKLVNFTAPYMRIGQLAILRTEDISEFSTKEKILATKKSVGFLYKTTGETFVNEHCISAQLKVPFDNIDDAVAALKNKKIDLFIADAPVIWAVSDTALAPVCDPLTSEDIGWAVRKNDPLLAEILNECLEIIKDNGTLFNIESRWVPELFRDSIYTH